MRKIVRAKRGGGPRNKAPAIIKGTIDKYLVTREQYSENETEKFKRKRKELDLDARIGMEWIRDGVNGDGMISAPKRMRKRLFGDIGVRDGGAKSKTRGGHLEGEQSVSSQWKIKMGSGEQKLLDDYFFGCSKEDKSLGNSQDLGMGGDV